MNIHVEKARSRKDIADMSRFSRQKVFRPRTKPAGTKQILHFLDTTLVFLPFHALLCMLGYNLASAEEKVFSYSYHCFFFSQITQSSRQVFSHRYAGCKQCRISATIGLTRGRGGGTCHPPPLPWGFSEL